MEDGAGGFQESRQIGRDKRIVPLNNCVFSDVQGTWTVESFMHFREVICVVLASAVGIPKSDSMLINKLPEEMNEMKIKDEKEMEATVVDGNGTETRHIVVTTIGGKNGQPKQTISYMAERVVGRGSFGIVFQIFRALAYIRGIGVCHRNIKPQNLLVNLHIHQVKLRDFGSAKVRVNEMARNFSIDFVSVCMKISIKMEEPIGEQFWRLLVSGDPRTHQIV